MTASAYGLPERSFDRIRVLLREHTGIVLSDSKRCMVLARLSRRMRALGLRSCREYLQRVEQEGAELRELISALSTHHTGFLRDAVQFRTLADEVLPKILRRKTHERRLRLWSAGCASGPEPYSIAMVMAETVPLAFDARILATDVDHRMVERASAGIYDESDLQPLSPARRQRFFLRGRGENRGRLRVSAELRRLVVCRQHNLVGSWSMRGPFDVVFCRNVLIYFDRETQLRILNRFADVMHPGGYLFVGHAESPALRDRLAFCAPSLFRRRS